MRGSAICRRGTLIEDPGCLVQGVDYTQDLNDTKTSTLAPKNLALHPCIVNTVSDGRVVSLALLPRFRI